MNEARFSVERTPRYFPSNELQPVYITVRGLQGRVEYQKILCGGPMQVIVDFYPDGRAFFADKEDPSTCWYCYEPSPDEQDFAVRLMQSQGKAEEKPSRPRAHRGERVPVLA